MLHLSFSKLCCFLHIAKEHCLLLWCILIDQTLAHNPSCMNILWPQHQQEFFLNVSQVWRMLLWKVNPEYVYEIDDFVNNTLALLALTNCYKSVYLNIQPDLLNLEDVYMRFLSKLSDERGPYFQYTARPHSFPYRSFNLLYFKYGKIRFIDLFFPICMIH